MKIQQMAFVLIALMIFFAMVGLFYFSIRTSSLKEDARSLREEEATEMVRKIASFPEFRWDIGSCDNCIDFDKALLLKNRKVYEGFWALDYLALEIIYPEKTEECSISNYPDCGKLTLINKGDNYGIPSSAFVLMCRQASSGNGIYPKCMIGKIYAAGKGVNS